MALPTTISTLVSSPYLNVGGPFLSSAGSVYVFVRSIVTNQIHVFKATDPSTGWGAAGVDFGVASGNTIRQIACVQDGDNIHVVSRDASGTTDNRLEYHVFSMAADGWTVMSEAVTGPYAIPAGSLPDDSPVDIMVRSNGDVVVIYEGPAVTADIPRSRVYFAIRHGSTWTADVSLDTGGNAHWIPGAVIRGANDNAHFFFHDLTNSDAYERTLNSSSAIEAISATAFDTQILPAVDAMAQRGVAYSASAGGTFVRYPYYNSFSPDMNDVKFSSSATPSLAVVTNITGATVISNIARHCISHAADGATVHSVFVDSNYDLYRMSNADDAGWSAPVLFYDAVSATMVFSNIYTRNSARVMGIVFQDTTNVRYTEYTISAVAAAPTIGFGRMMMGMGR